MQSLIKLQARDIIDAKTEFHYAHILSIQHTTGLHNHDFFELFLITKGAVYHNINDTQSLLKAGTLVFIRPSDIHSYQQGEIDCQFINLAFLPSTLFSLFDYLGEGFSGENLLTSTSPPQAQLTTSQVLTVSQWAKDLYTIPRTKPEQIRAQLRILLFKLFTQFFPNFEQHEPSIPLWLEQLHQEMQKKEHFIEGLPSMKKLSTKSGEHLSRMFRKYYHMTPTQYINELRLNYAANLLVSTDLPIVSIALDVGFNNISHFYHLFKAEFQLSPAHFRKMFSPKILSV